MKRHPAQTSSWDVWGLGSMIAISLILLYGWLIWYRAPFEVHWQAFETRAFEAFFPALWKARSAVGSLALLLLAFYLLGSLTVRFVLGCTQPFPIKILIGEAIWALIPLLFGTLGYLNQGVLAALVFAAAASQVIIIVLQALRKGVRLSGNAPWELCVPIAFSLPLLLVILHPTIFYDAQVYHLALPRTYLMSQSTAPIEWNVYSHFPSAGEMLFTLGWAVGGQFAAQWMVGLHWAVALLLLWEIGRMTAGERAGKIALILGAITPAILLSSATMGVDTLLMAAALGSIYGLVRCRKGAEEENEGEIRRGVVIWSLFAGFSVGIKYTAILYVAAAGCAVLLMNVGKLPPRRIFSILVLGSLPLLLLAAPWFARNLWATGNPVYPWPLTGASLQGGPLQALRNDAHMVHLVSASLWELIRLPLDAVFDHPVGIERRFGVASFLGAQIYAGLVLLALRAGRRTAHRDIAIFAAISLAAWAVTFRMTRFALPGIGALILLSAVGFDRAWERSWPLRCAVLLTLFSATAINGSVVLRSAAGLTGDFALLTKRVSPRQYLLLRSMDRPVEAGSLPLIAELNRRLPPRAKLIFVGESATLYVDRPVIASTAVDENPLLGWIEKGKSSEEILEELHELEITHLLFRPGEMLRLANGYGHPISPPMQRALNGFLNRLGPPILAQKNPVIWVFGIPK